MILALGSLTNLSGLLQGLLGRHLQLDLATQVEPLTTWPPGHLATWPPATCPQTVAYLAVPPREVARLASMPATSTFYPRCLHLSPPAAQWPPGWHLHPAPPPLP